MDITSELSTLIESITSLPSKDSRHGSLNSESARTLQNASTSLINQFAVKDRLIGLEERWRISGEDEAADALAQRLQRLYDLEDDGTYAKVPECLQLLLSLSSGQLNVCFEQDLAEIKLKTLRINDRRLSRENFTDDGALWATIDYRGGGSDDESLLVASSAVQKGRPQGDLEDSSSSQDDIDDRALFMDSDDDDESHDYEFIKHKVATLEKAQVGEREQVSEATIIREAIHMLQGLPTHLFDISPSKQVLAIQTIGMRDVSSDVVQSIMHSFADLGSRIVPLMDWTRSEEQSPTLRRFQAAVRSSLENLLAELRSVEHQNLDPRKQPPSAISLYAQLRESVRPVELVGACLPAPSGHDRDAILLNNIVHLIAEQESVGADTDYLITTFLGCFTTFWRPVESWLQGSNIDCDGITFVHAADERDLPLDGVWKGLFDYTYNEEGAFKAPQFLQSFIPKLLTIGKTAYMLNKLEQQQVIHRLKPPDDWLSAVLIQDRHPWEPFEDCLHRAIACRVKMSHELSEALLKHLHGSWAFGRTILALELVYLARLGSINDKAYSALFRLIDRSQHHEWQDQHVLTGLFQEAFSDSELRSSAHLTASFVPTDRSTGSRRRSLVKLEAVRLNLTISWPLANIVDAGSISVLQRAAVLLMQVARAKDVLNQYAVHFDPRLMTDKHSRRVLISLQQRLRWFVNTLHSYLAFDILSSASLGLSASSADPGDLDSVIGEFKLSMEMLERGCLLSEDLSSTHQAVISILDLAVVLSDLCLRHRPDLTMEHGKEFSDEEEDSGGQRRQAIEPLVTNLDPDSTKLQGLSATFHQLLIFVQARVRNASRTESDRRLELLADDLALELKSLRWD